MLTFRVVESLCFGNLHVYKEVLRNKKDVVRLTDEERALGEATIKKEKGTPEKRRRATILLRSDADGPAWDDAKISEAEGPGYTSRGLIDVRPAFLLLKGMFDMCHMTWNSGALLALLLMTGPGRADDAKDEVLKLSKAYDAAIKAQDAKALDKLFDADGQFILEDGRLLNKRQAIAEITTKKVIESVTMEEHSIRVLGETAIETGRWSATGKGAGGQPFQRRVRFTAVWAKKGGTWVVTLDHVTTIADKK